MRTKTIYVPRKQDPSQYLDELDGVGRAYDVPEQCADDWECLQAFAESQWFERAKHRGPYFTCFRCEFAGGHGKHIEQDEKYGPCLLFESRMQGTGEKAPPDYKGPVNRILLGRVCAECQDRQRIENYRAKDRVEVGI